MEAPLYNIEGQRINTVQLPPQIFGLRWNADLVSQVIRAMRSNARANTAQVKDRSLVRGGGRKPWRQKGTGRARHGSIRSPLWRGGGVTHGPTTARNYDKRINKKTKIKALYTLLSRKLRDNEIIFVNHLPLAQSKTKEAQEILNRFAVLPDFAKINYRRGRRTLLVLPQPDEKTIKSFRNIPATAVTEARQLNPLTVATYRYLMLVEPEQAIAVLAGRKK